MLSSSRVANSLVRPIRSFCTTGSRHYAVADNLSSSPDTSVPPLSSEKDTSTRSRSFLPQDGTSSASSPGFVPVPRRRTILARPNMALRNMNEALILLRAMEKEFGPVREFQFPRVSSITSSYAHYEPPSPLNRTSTATLLMLLTSLSTSKTPRYWQLVGH
jgi:hypothetical protein